MKYFYLFFIVILSVSGINAQVPNSGFESWTDDITPQEWGTNNFPTVWTTVSKTSTAHTGSFAARLEVADFNGGPIYPALSITFPINQDYVSLNGYYQFYPTNNEMVLIGLAYTFKDGLIIGTGILEIESASSNYSQFSAEILGNNQIPDSIMIQFQIFSNSQTDPGMGSYAFIDQLSFGQATDVEETNQNPNEFRLAQNYPNPFNPSTSIQYRVSSISQVILKVYDILGNEVATLVDEYKPAGSYEIDFNASKLTSGVYFYKLQAGGFVVTKKMILLR